MSISIELTLQIPIKLDCSDSSLSHFCRINTRKICSIFIRHKICKQKIVYFFNLIYITQPKQQKEKTNPKQYNSDNIIIYMILLRQVHKM